MPNYTSSTSNVSDQATNTTLLAANGNRRGFIIYNDSTASLYLKYGTTASTSSFTYLVLPGGAFGDDYQGQVDGLWSADTASGAARITELLP